MKQKRCTKCKKVKPLSEYRTNKHASDGRRSECAECTKAYMRKWRKRNAEKVRKYQLEWQRANKDKVRQYAKTFHAKRPSYATEQSRRYRAKYPKKAKAAAHRHFIKNRERYYLREKEYRARKKNNTTEPFSQDDWQHIIDHYGGRCAYCGEIPKTLTMDHVIPLSKGGPHSLDNVAPSCFSCNRVKAFRTPEEANMPLKIKPPPSLTPE